MTGKQSAFVYGKDSLPNCRLSVKRSRLALQKTVRRSVRLFGIRVSFGSVQNEIFMYKRFSLQKCMPWPIQCNMGKCSTINVSVPQMPFVRRNRRKCVVLPLALQKHTTCATVLQVPWRFATNPMVNFSCEWRFILFNVNPVFCGSVKVSLNDELWW